MQAFPAISSSCTPEHFPSPVPEWRSRLSPAHPSYRLFREFAEERVMTPRELEEYRALRATIRERGTARIWIFVVGLLGWAGLVTATAALAALLVAPLLPVP